MCEIQLVRSERLVWCIPFVDLVQGDSQTRVVLGRRAIVQILNPACCRKRREREDYGELHLDEVLSFQRTCRIERSYLQALHPGTRTRFLSDVRLMKIASQASQASFHEASSQLCLARNHQVSDACRQWQYSFSWRLVRALQ